VKIAISATGPTLDDQVDPRFGRCPYFIIADPETMEFEAVGNSSAMTASGAGISTAQMIANKGAQAVLSGNCGPNAYQVLSAAGLQAINGVTGKIRDAIEGYKAGRFQATAQPNVAAHFGMGATPGMGMGGGMGMGRGMGMGKGRGMGMMGMGMTSPVGPTPQAASSEEEVNMLKSQTQMLRQQLEELQQRLKELEGKNR
jgi:predicted Fe-Mo cluster-binding NifX family protein